MKRTTLLAAWLLGTTLSYAVPASAQPSGGPSAGELERAERLFQDGKALMNERRFEEGCPKLAESQKIDPATGTLLALALCHEGQGKVATALKEFKLALPAAQSEKRRDRAELASGKVGELTPRVPKLMVQVPVALADEPTLAVTVDGERLERTSFNTQMLVDPGEHVIEARAEGRRSWRATITISERETRTATIPALHRDDNERPLASGPGPRVPLKEIGIALVSAGGVALIAGSVFGLNAISKNDEAKALCDANACTSAKGLALNDDARGAATASTILFVSGVLLAGGGATLLLVSRNKRTSAAPLVGPGFLGVRAEARF